MYSHHCETGNDNGSGHFLHFAGRNSSGTHTYPYFQIKWAICLTASDQLLRLKYKKKDPIPSARPGQWQELKF